MAIDPLNLAGSASLTFKAVFVSLSLWNGTSGTWDTDYWYDPVHSNGNTLSNNGEQEWYINTNYSPTQSVTPWTIANNVLTITAAKAPDAVRPLINDYKYTSGEINTFHSFSQTYGYFEMRARLPEGKGLWPAFWLLPENGSWPPELDIMEVLGSDLTTLYTTVHYGSSNKSKGIAVTVPDMSKGFHDFGADWEADTITWYFDRKPVYRVKTPADMHKPMFIEANLAAGGYWPGKVDPRELPAGMQIEYIKAWSAMPGGKTNNYPISDDRRCKGKIFYANDKAGEVLRGTPCDDTFYAGHNSVIMEGRGGADVFIFNDVPWNAGRITDFVPGQDKIHVGALLSAIGYMGSEPFSDGVLSVVPTRRGGTELHLHQQTVIHGPSDILVTTLDHVEPSSLNLENDFVPK